MIKLNLGCGTDVREGFLNIDVRNLPNVDIVSTLENLPFEDNYADLIVAQDVLEHFCRIELGRVLEEIKRVLKIGGILEIRVPDCEQILNKYKWGELQLDHALAYLYGGQDYVENVHKNGFTKANTKYIMEYFGFEVLELYTCDATNLKCVAKKEGE